MQKEGSREGCSQARVALACNPSYSGGRDQEDCDLKPAWASSSRDLIEKSFTKKGLVEWLKVEALNSNPNTIKKKKKKGKRWAAKQLPEEELFFPPPSPSHFCPRHNEQAHICWQIPRTYYHKATQLYRGHTRRDTQETLSTRLHRKRKKKKSVRLGLEI
jgi:hypothetical protein